MAQRAAKKCVPKLAKKFAPQTAQNSFLSFENEIARERAVADHFFMIQNEQFSYNKICSKSKQRIWPKIGQKIAPQTAQNTPCLSPFDF